MQAQCMIDSVSINSLLIDPTGDDASYDTNNDGIVNSNDEYIEICNLSTESEVDISGWQIGDDDPPPYADYVIPDGTLLLPGDCIVLVTDYCGDGTLIDTMDCTVPEGVLDMNFSGTALLGNNGDIVTLADSLGENSCSVTYGNVVCEGIDILDIPAFDITNCDYWGDPTDGCALLAEGDSCSYFPSVLSLDLLSFDVSNYLNQEVLIQWITATEYNSNFFSVEWRKGEDSNFQSIDRIFSEGNSDVATPYSYVHQTPAEGNNYYRLREVDISGQHSFSPTRVISISYKDEIRLIPNLSETEIRVNGNADSYLISIFDLKGQMIVDKIETLNNQTINISGLEQGHYFMSIFNKNYTIRKRFIKI